MNASSTRFQMYRPNRGTLLSVALVAPVFPPLELHGFVWIALVPWLLGLRSCGSMKEAATQGFWLNFLIGFFWAYWLPLAVPQYLGLPLALGILALTLNTSIHQLHMVLVAAALHWLLRRAEAPLSIATLVLIALLYTGLDWIMPGIFQHTLGIALHDYRSLVQLVEVGGAPLLTFVVLIVNLCLFSIVQIALDLSQAKRVRRLGFIARAVLVAAVILGSWGYGAIRYRQVSAAIDASTRTVRVGMVQGNVPNDIKRRWRDGDHESARQTLDLYLRSTQELFEQPTRPDLIVWPETSYPGIFRKPENQAQASLNVSLDRYIAQQGTPFVLGAYDREDRTDIRILRNAIFFIEPAPDQPVAALSRMTIYHKYILFPVGEYLPLASERVVRKWLPAAGSFSRGEGPKVVAVDLPGHDEPLELGPSICYEDLFPSHAIGLARGGAELLVNVSNDSWFGDYGLPRFHLIFAKLRSIETRLPQVRVTNTGYSALILPNGDVRRESEYGRRQAITWSVPITRQPESLITAWGDWFGPTSLIVAIAGMLLMRGQELRG